MAIIVGIVLLLIGIAYGVGRFQTHSAVGTAEENARSVTEESQRKDAALAEQRQAVARLEARRRLHLAVIAMDERNFGTAQQHLDVAGKILNESAKGTPVGELAKPILTNRLHATEDLGAQRQQVLQWVKRFDTLAPPAAAP